MVEEYIEFLRELGINNECNMGCMSTCFEFEPWPSCYNECACHEVTPEPRQHAELLAYQGIGVCTTSRDYLPEPDWNIVSMNHGRCHYENFYNDGSSSSWTCHGPRECGATNVDEELMKHFLGRRQQIRVAAAAAFSKIASCGTDEIVIEKETRSEDETQITVSNEEGRVTFQIIHDENFPNSFEIHLMTDSDDNQFSAWAMLRQSLDGSYVVAIANY